MIQQLILSTLFACQPKSETEVPTPTLDEKPIETPKEMPKEEVTKEEIKPAENVPPKEKPETAVKKSQIEIVKELSKPKTGDESKRFYAGEVNLSHIPYPRDTFTDEQFCNYVCANAHASGPKRLTNVENCQVELLENWEELRKDFTWEQVTDNNPVVGITECNADLSYIRKGRPALSQTNGSETQDNLGGYFARAAQEEMTAVFAFQEMKENLKSFGAPQQLLDDCEKAICDEQRHMIMMSNMAKRHGCESALIKLPEQKQVSIFELAKHNAIAGCIDETWSALVAEYQAKHTKHYTKLFTIIAKDEVFHAQLSWDIHQWLMTQLSEEEKSEIQELMSQHLKKTQILETNYSNLGEMTPAEQRKIWTEFSSQIEKQQLLEIA